MFYKILLAVSIMSVIAFCCFGCSDQKSADAVSQTAMQSTTKVLSEKEKLQFELKEKYGINKPLDFQQDFSTNGQKYVVISNETPPSSYAVKYANAYMEPGDLHYICNLYLNTTTKIGIIDIPLEDGDYTVKVETHEYERLEEMDVRTIGEGMLLTTEHFSYNTGKEFTAETDETAGTVSVDDLVSSVEEIIADAVSDEEVLSVSFDGKDLCIKDDLSNVDLGVLPARDFAESQISSITDSVLELEDEYYNTWETVTVDFGSVGKATFDKSMVVDNGYGKFFQYDGNALQ